MEYETLFQQKNQEEPPCLCFPIKTLTAANGTALTPIPYKEGEWRGSAMRKCPAYAQVPKSLLRPHEKLRVLFLYQELTYARQCGAMLCGVAHQREFTGDDQDEPFFLEFPQDLLPDEEPDLTENQLISAPLSILSNGSESSSFPDHLRNALATTDSLLLYGGDNLPISYDELHQFLNFAKNRDLFIALKQGNCPNSWVDNLTFEHDFLLCPVGINDTAYQKRLFRAQAKAEGITLAPSINLTQVLNQLKAIRGPRFEETDFQQLLQKTKRQHGTTLNTTQLLLKPYSHSQNSAKLALEKLVDRKFLQEEVRRILAYRLYQKRMILKGASAVPPYCHLAFAGPPGTCKSQTARLIAQILQEEGCGSGAFLEVGREGLIGGYLGQTSLKVEQAFQKAKGGVLFIDEAGALVSHDTNRDIFVEEAVNALVRHMELSPDTMVIFATYEKEMEQLLSSNPGLRSRIARVVHFDGYSSQSLWNILVRLAEDRGVEISSQGETLAKDYFELLKERSGESFGNGREARRLLETAMEELALRVVGTTNSNDTLLTAQDLEQAVQRLRPRQKPRNKIGFS